jgi:hypothetical protein
VLKLVSKIYFACAYAVCWLNVPMLIEATGELFL